MRSKKLIYSLTIICSFCVSALVVNSQPKSSYSALKWQKLTNGIESTEIEYGKWFNKGKLYGIKIQAPRKLKILVGDNKSSSLESLEKKYKPLITINGSYFQENYLPAGLLKINNKTVSKLNKYGGSGVLAIKGNQIAIFHKDKYPIYNDKFPELMQNGPLLVENNGKMGIYSDDKKYSARTAIGITRENKTLIVVADMAAAPSLYELSEIMTKPDSEGGFGCKVALNLDGGSSTGLRINIPGKRLVIEELEPVANGLGVF